MQAQICKRAPSQPGPSFMLGHGLENNASRRMLQRKWEKLAFIREACLKIDKIDNVQRARTRNGEASLLFLKRNVQWCVNGVEHLVARKIRYANASP